MYEAHFGLAGRPFLAAALADRFYPARAIESARRILARAIERCEGVGIVLGPAGTGKSLLCQVLLDQFRDRLACVLLSGGRLTTRKALLRNLLFELGLTTRGLEEDELWLALAEQFAQGMPLACGLLLLVDEAHLLSPRLLEELRLVTDFTCGGKPCVRLVLAGCSELEQKLAHPRLTSLEQRMAARCVLEPLGGDEVQAYVHAQLALVAGRAELFGDAALAVVSRVTEGIPRLINQVCDHALILAYADGEAQVSPTHVERAWADLQQLPLLSVHRGDSNGAERGCVIEFGGLEEDSPAMVQTLEFPQPAASAAGPNFAAEEALSQYLAEAHAAPSVVAVGEGGEVAELLHEAAFDPFGGPFAEEEVVLDRFANYDDTLFRTLPHVASPESRWLSSLLEPRMAPPPGPRLVVAPSADADECEVLPQIVVEDDPYDERARLCCQAAAGAQRIEYTQLFSRLRG